MSLAIFCIQFLVGVVWVLETNKVPKDGLEKTRREQKPKKEVIEVSPVKKHAKIKDHFLILKDSDGSNTSIKLKGCSIEPFSIYLEISWEKESWSKALRLASCEDKKQLEWFAKIDSSSKVRMLWKKFTKKASLGCDERKIGEKYRSGTSLKKTTTPVDAVKSSVDYDEKIGIDEGTLCWNLLISRLFFDAKRNTDIRRSLHGWIQVYFSIEIYYVLVVGNFIFYYIGDVICKDIYLGNVPPYIHGTRCLPMDMNEVWALEVNIEYSGGAILGIETRLEVRELDHEKSMTNSNSASSSVEDVPSNLLEGFEYLEKQLNLTEGTTDELEHKGGDKLKSSKSSVPASTNLSKWKSLVSSIAKQVSQHTMQVQILRVDTSLQASSPRSQEVFDFSSTPFKPKDGEKLFIYLVVSKAATINIQSDSQIVVNQLHGTYQARDLKMASYLDHVKNLQSTFEEFNIVQVPRLENSHADALVNLSSFIPTTESQAFPLLYLQWPTI
ncbi:hypothetical protein UlMin_037213 [Ulmus minor]